MVVGGGGFAFDSGGSWWICFGLILRTGGR